MLSSLKKYGGLEHSNARIKRKHSRAVTGCGLVRSSVLYRTSNGLGEAQEVAVTSGLLILVCTRLFLVILRSPSAIGYSEFSNKITPLGRFLTAEVLRAGSVTRKL
jgi:hypothetical protein